METTQVTQPDPDAAKYAELAKELGIEPEAKEPQPAPEPEAKVEPTPEQRTVPYGEHENVQKALREAREQARASDERLRGIMQLVEQSRTTRREPEKKDEPPKLPDVQEDPVKYMLDRFQQMEDRINQTQQGTQYTDAQLRAYQQTQQLHQALNSSEAEIRDARNPNHKADYDDACEHLRNVRVAQIEYMFQDQSPYAQDMAYRAGFNSVQAFRQKLLSDDIGGVAVSALQQGISPAVMFYDLAVRAGYQPKTAKPNGKDNVVSLADKAKQAFEVAKKGQTAAVTVSGSNAGRKGADDVSMADLADLFIEDPEMADKIWDQMARAGKLG